MEAYQFETQAKYMRGCIKYLTEDGARKKEEERESSERIYEEAL